AARVRAAGGPALAVLAGGVFQNRLLTRFVGRELEARGLAHVDPGEIPVNDGGLALGQVLVANAAEGA
ncbi:MAG: carbamoyltransferase HypF, partial [Planctomycetota bacterium]